MFFIYKQIKKTEGMPNRHTLYSIVINRELQIIQP